MATPARIVITGRGALCAAGLDADAILDSILEGRSSISAINAWESSSWPCRTAGMITARTRDLLNDRKLLKLIKASDVYGIYAAEQALESANINAFRSFLPAEQAETFADQFAIFVGTSGPGYNTQYDFFDLIEELQGEMNHFGEKLGESVNPMWLLRNLPNNVLCHVGIRNNLKGANGCITDHSTSGSLALIEAYEALRIGDAERAVAIGHEAPVEPQTVLYYRSLGLLAPEQLLPFDRQRQGSILGDGAAALVLETEQAAAERRVPILGEILGKGISCEATGLLPIRPDGDGVVRAIRLALHQANLEPGQIGMVVCHGNGTPASDHSEGLALRTVFGTDCPPITSFKWAFGHLIAASGSIDTVLALTALERGIVPGIASLKTVDPALQDLPIATAAMQPVADTALILSRGFGGQNTALIIKGNSASSTV